MCCIAVSPTFENVERQKEKLLKTLSESNYRNSVSDSSHLKFFLSAGGIDLV